jgi:arabinogalactan oligomer / maltooligosaccharide transport system permease protein
MPPVQRSRKVLTHAFLILFTLGVMFPVAKVFQVALQAQQTFDMSLLPFPKPALFTLQNFADVITREKVLGLGPELSSAEVERLARFLASVPEAAEPGWDVPPDQAAFLTAKRCFACHALGSQGRAGLGGDLRAAARLGEDKLAAWLGAPTRDNALALGLGGPAPSGAMERRAVWLFGRQLLNSVVAALVTTLFGIFLACTAAYAFSRFRFPGRRAGLLSFLVIQMFPGTMMMIPLYILVDKLGLLDQLLGLVLVYSVSAIPFCVWTLKGFFDTIPKELEESALIDGASRIRIFWSIILPLARPAIAVTALFSFMAAWNEFILAATFMNDETAQTLPVMLNGYVSETTVEWGHFAAGAILVSVPVVLLFFVLQKNLVGGLTAGGVKG